VQGGEAAIDRGRVEERMSPALSDERFPERKAALLQLTGHTRAV